MSLFLHSNQKILLALTIPFLCQYKLKKLYKLFEFFANNSLYIIFFLSEMFFNRLSVQIVNRVPLYRHSCRNIVFSTG